MSKGNLYTHIIPHHSQEIEILSELKKEWKSKPHNFKRIKELRNKLKKLGNAKDSEKTIKSIFNGEYNPKPKKYKGLYY